MQVWSAAVTRLPVELSSTMLATVAIAGRRAVASARASVVSLGPSSAIGRNWTEKATPKALCRLGAARFSSSGEVLPEEEHGELELGAGAAVEGVTSGSMDDWRQPGTAQVEQWDDGAPPASSAWQPL